MSCVNAEPGTPHARRPTTGVRVRRCATCRRSATKLRAATAADRRVHRVFGLTPAEYAALYEAQGGRCAFPGCRATGRARRLAVDHDHASGRVRGLLCRLHNYGVFGKCGDNPETYLAAAEYLRNPPALAVLGERLVPTTEAGS